MKTVRQVHEEIISKQEQKVLKVMKMLKRRKCIKKIKKINVSKNLKIFRKEKEYF